MPTPRRTTAIALGAGAAALATAGAVVLQAPSAQAGSAVPRAAAATGDTAPLPGVSFTLKSTPVSAAALQRLDEMAANPARGMTRQADLSAASAGAQNGLTYKTGCPAGNDAVKAMDAKVKVGAWCFDNGDKSTDQWIPQGVATSRSRQLDGLVLSWYHRHLSGDKWVTDGSRVTVGPRPRVEAKGAYQPVTLAIPTTTAEGRLVVKDVRPSAAPGGGVSAKGVAEATQHQGGTALVGDFLYTADTAGLRVYDVRRTYRVATGKNKLGVDADGKFYAHNEKYALFQTGMYRPENAGACPAWEKPPSAQDKDLCFSTVTYDPTSKSLVTGEFKTAGGVTAARPMRVVRWPLNDDGSLKADASGRVKSSIVFGGNVLKAQGVGSYHSDGGDTVYYNTSNGGSPGAVYADRDGDGKAPFKLTGPIGGESLAYDPYSGGDRMYGVTERKNQRMIYWTYRKDMQHPGMP